MKAHEYSLLYPEMLPDEFESMKASIKLIGQQDPITTLNGEILDGRHRYKACKELGIKPVTEEYNGDDPLSFVLAKHSRRNLSESQRAIVAAKLCTLKVGTNQHTHQCASSFSVKKADEIQKVSPRLVTQARSIMRDRPEGVPDIEAGISTIGESYRSIQIERSEALHKKKLEEQKKYQADGEAGKLPQDQQEEFDKRIKDAIEAEERFELFEKIRQQKIEDEVLREDAKNAWGDIESSLHKILQAREKFGFEEIEKEAGDVTVAIIRVTGLWQQVLSEESE